ncbi:phosphoribosylformylglycinamidine synthase [bacterium]|nr:phosphoribosylformylglycinamidine synthase [bacterium]
MHCVEVFNDESRSVLGLEKLCQSRVYYLEGPQLHEVLAELQRDSRALADPVREQIRVDELRSQDFQWLVEVAFRNGVTDNEARVVEEVLESPQLVARSARRYYVWGGPGEREAMLELAGRHWANQLVQRIQVIRPGEELAPPPPLQITPVPPTQSLPLPVQDEGLAALSRSRLLALSVEEMRAIREHFGERAPTEVELEALAQTWSEHCKHKIFRDTIIYQEDGHELRVEGLFPTYIAGATAACQRDWLVSVFTDNAGVIAWSQKYHLVFKVETHNAPSALEPYGGALTGIVGVNRDPAGTGLGCDLLFNTDVFCFGPLDYTGNLPPNVHHPRRLYEGVRQGVEDGGNQSGIPTVNGGLFFDQSFLGRPLVFCGTGALMEVSSGHLKSIRPGDFIVMAGGRVGKDGIHGATFSSQAIGAEAPVGVVQIGDPMTQKRLLEMLGEARKLGLYRAITDNGAGGLCSSVGEMAEMSGGAHLTLETVPLKYPGLAPWEILVSESQERMTLAVPPERWGQLLELAQRREVEVTVVGSFNASGKFSASYYDEKLMDLSLEFLHSGFPRRLLRAEWTGCSENDRQLPPEADWRNTLCELLASPNICSRQALIRQYDHEVQGTSVIKPLVGVARDGPSDAAVLRPDHASDQGMAVSCALNPHYGIMDCEVMAELLVDEALRNLVAVGADPDHAALLDNFCWPDPIGDPHKTAQLVRCCRGLDRAVRAFQAPLISGKDSMKNDYHGPDGKLSILPTLLVSGIANLPDIQKAVSMDFKQAGDLVYLVGAEQSALGCSQLARRRDFEGGRLGRLDYDRASQLYRCLHRLMQAEKIAACHDCSEGGLAVALAEMCIAGRLGLDWDLPESELSLEDRLFGEAPSRLVLAIDPRHQQAVESALGQLPFTRLGRVLPEACFRFRGETIDLDKLIQSWQGELNL